MSRDFWSRRREAVAKEVEAEEAKVAAAAVAEREAAQAEKSDEALLAEAGFVAPEELETSEAVREFLQSDLPQRLKTRALRKLWRTNPVLACLDGLNDYDDDYTVASAVGVDVKTTYQVGKGLLRHVEALAEQKRKAAAPQVAEPAPEEIAEEEEPVTLADAAEAPVETPVVARAEDEDFTPTPRRRMTFVFDEQRTA